MVQKNPKVVSLKSMFEKLFPMKTKVQSAKDQADILRHIIEVEKND